MKNSWPEGKKKALYPEEHEKWNAKTYPGTRQLCDNCGNPTDRCEEDKIISLTGETICEECNKEQNYE